jgi:hypothetical protein
MNYFIVIIRGKIPLTCVFTTYDEVAFLYTGDFQTAFYKFVLDKKIMDINGLLYTKEISPEDHSKFIKLFDNTLLGDLGKYNKIAEFISDYVNIREQEEEQEEEDYDEEDDEEEEYGL